MNKEAVNQDLEAEQLDALLNSFGYISDHEPSFEDLLKTPQGIQEAKSRLQELKRRTDEINNLQRLINEAEKQQESK